MSSLSRPDTRPDQPIRLYRHPLSGHSHRVELFLSLLGLPCDPVDVDLLKGAHKAPEFLAMNAFGQVPVIQDGALTLADSNAILVYLASRYAPGTGWLPAEPSAHAQVQRWLCAAAGPLVTGPGSARLSALFGQPRDARAHEIAGQLFGVMEHELTQRLWLAGAQPTLADVALYTYTAHAPEGGVSLAPYPRLRAWLARVEALPGFVGMAASPAQAA